MMEVFESSNSYRIVPGVHAKTLTDDILEYVYDGGGFMPNDEETPMPWDADVEIKNGNMVITGSVAPGGGYKGTVVVTLPLQEANKLYHADIYDAPVSVINKLVDLGWGVKAI